MPSTLAERLASQPIERLTTVLRLDVQLRQGSAVNDQAQELVDTWLRGRAEKFGFDQGIQGGIAESEACRLEIERAERAYAFALEERRSPTREPQDWITDVSLAPGNGTSLSFGLRLRYRQPQDWKGRLPQPRAPRFLKDLVERELLEDVWPLKATASRVGQGEFDSFLSLLRTAERTLPVVVVSEENDYDELTLVDVAELASYLSGTAHVVLLSARTTWLLSDALTREWSVFQGAVRCYAPGLDPNTKTKFKHRLWLADAIQRLGVGPRGRFLDECIRHVFTQCSATFEARPLISPATLRRSRERSLQEPLAIPVASISSASAVTLEAVPTAEEPVYELQLRLRNLEDALEKQRGEIVRLRQDSNGI